MLPCRCGADTANAILKIEERAGATLFDHQRQAVEHAAVQPEPQRRCLYYKTGAGKTFTSLAQVLVCGYNEAVVIAPPSTHHAWMVWGTRTDVKVYPMSHAKFRMKDTKLDRHTPVIADEFHLFGGQSGAGFKKLQGLARGLKAPLILASATPNYNDAERVYCIQSILDPASTKGGFLQFLYRHCNTEQNPFGMVPLVDEDQPFINYKDARDFLSSLPNVDYLPDDLVYTIEEVDYWEPSNQEMDRFGYDRRNHRIIASQMEERHTRRYQGLVNERGLIHDAVFDKLLDQMDGKAVLIFANHETVASALARTFEHLRRHTLLVTGKTSKKDKDLQVNAFKDGQLDILIGTASLATGTDGLDKVCDTLVILDDTDDDALRRQLIGRIMPRGSDTDTSRKRVVRLNPL